MINKIIFFLVFIFSFLAVFLYFGDYTKKLILLKQNGEKIDARITDIKKYKSGKWENKLSLSLLFEYENKTYREKIIVYEGVINSYLSDYQLGNKIGLLINKDKWFIRPENSINKEIIRNIIFLFIGLPLLISFIVISLINYLYKKYFNINSKTANKIYEFYSQNNNYKIKIEKRSNNITKNYLNEFIDIDKLKNGEILCYGTSKNEYFVELSYANDQYVVRIFFGKEKEEVYDGNSDIINEYYDMVKKYVG
jgi:hypothetical protein